MALHGGQANLTKDKYSQMNQSMPSRSWSQFGTGASGSGSSASSTPAVATPSSAFSKAICDAPVKLSWASVEHDIKEAKGAQERLGRDCQRPAAKILDKKEQQINDTLKDVLTELQRQYACLDNVSIANCFITSESSSLLTCSTYHQIV